MTGYTTYFKEMSGFRCRSLRGIYFLLGGLLYAALFGQCANDPDAQYREYSSRLLDYTVSEAIHLPLDSSTPPSIGYFQILRGDTLKYVFYNGFNRSLYIYDFRSEKLIRKLTLEYAGGELPNINAFYYINPDSILYFPQYGDYYLIGNETGNIYSGKVNFVDEDDKNKIESHWITSSNPVIKIENTIYINNVFGWIAQEGDLEKFLLITHDLGNGRSEFILQHPPSIYRKNFENTTFRHLVFTLKETDQTLLYSFNFDPYVYEYKKNAQNVLAHYCAPEGYVLPPKLKKGISSDEAWLIFQTTFTFSKLTHDPYRNVLIRLALTPYQLEDIKSGSVNPEMPKKPKFYLFDHKYDLLGEIPLDESANYYFINMFATEEGIYIQKLLDDENVMCFELINYER